jgi:heme A synthase
MGDAAWQAEFSRYQTSPQFAKVNQDMSLGDFKVIFWFEFFHRLLARLLGLWFALPLLWFWLRGAIPARLRWPLFGILALGAAQGYMGWYMVKSGLVDIPRVSPYRLAAHLGLALLVYALMLRVAIGLLLDRVPAADSSTAQRWPRALLLVMVATTIGFGAFVAGLRAGHMYNTFPLMAGYWIPPGLGCDGAAVAQPVRESGERAVHPSHHRAEHAGGDLVGLVAHAQCGAGQGAGQITPCALVDGAHPGDPGHLHPAVGGAGVAGNPASGRCRASAQRGHRCRLVLAHA